ncbi:uncharacterized protein LOC120403139 [Mauremys reevesii]|uniref:uncharacterized protein LOC120403139 n=1 Tax=Mauremys reevesii TaxID=260615 RepID=UPI00193EDE59|nr:uncharacterized protein LOC120403139 [Mauremys reevesii]
MGKLSCDRQNKNKLSHALCLTLLKKERCPSPQKKRFDPLFHATACARECPAPWALGSSEGHFDEVLTNEKQLVLSVSYRVQVTHNLKWILLSQYTCENQSPPGSQHVRLNSQNVPLGLGITQRLNELEKSLSRQPIDSDEESRPDATDEENQKNMERIQRKSSYQLKPQGEFQRAGVNATYTWSQKKQKPPQPFLLGCSTTLPIGNSHPLSAGSIPRSPWPSHALQQGDISSSSHLLLFLTEPVCSDSPVIGFTRPLIAPQCCSPSELVQAGSTRSGT